MSSWNFIIHNSTIILKRIKITLFHYFIIFFHCKDKDPSAKEKKNSSISRRIWKERKENRSKDSTNTKIFKNLRLEWRRISERIVSSSINHRIFTFPFRSILRGGEQPSFECKTPRRQVYEQIKISGSKSMRLKRRAEEFKGSWKINRKVRRWLRG